MIRAPSKDTDAKCDLPQVGPAEMAYAPIDGRDNKREELKAQHKNISIPLGLGVHVMVAGVRRSGRSQLIETLKERSKTLRYPIIFHEVLGRCDRFNLEGELTPLLGQCDAIVFTSEENGKYLVTYESNVESVAGVNNRTAAVTDDAFCRKWRGFIQDLVHKL